MLAPCGISQLNASNQKHAAARSMQRLTYGLSVSSRSRCGMAFFPPSLRLLFSPPVADCCKLKRIGVMQLMSGEKPFGHQVSCPKQFVQCYSTLLPPTNKPDYKRIDNLTGKLQPNKKKLRRHLVVSTHDAYMRWLDCLCVVCNCAR